MKIQWKQKLCSRKFWAAVLAFVTAVLSAFGWEDLSGSQVAVIVSGCATLAAYILGEGIADAGRGNSAGKTEEQKPDSD